jgi:selenocysteine lyase/cysteine desulfurase
MIYADYAATNGAVPLGVRQAVAEYLAHPGNPGRGAHPAALDAARAVLDARIRLAEFFGCADPARVVFTSGITESLNTVLEGLLRPGDHVVTTRYEHNSVLRPLYRLEAERGVQVTFTDGSPAAIAAALRPQTRAVVMTHASNVTGTILDVRAVGRLCRAQGVLLVVDSAQSAGALPLSLREDGIDLLCFTGHKGLLGLQGVGGIVFADAFSWEDAAFRPLKVGGSGIRSFDRAHPAALPEALEAGTLNVPGIISLAAAQDELARRGLANILRHEQALADAFEQALEGCAGVRCYHPEGATGTARVGIVSLDLDGMDAAVAADRLAQNYGIAVRAGAHCAPLIHRHYGTDSMVRFSFGWENTREDAQTCAEAVRALAREAHTRQP